MKRSGFIIMMRLIKLVKPLSKTMVLAIVMGLLGHLCATFITILGGYGILSVLKTEAGFHLGTIFIVMAVFAVARGILRYAEQACNHYIAFKLLALIREKVFEALRRLCPAKLEVKDKGNLISIITSDIELLEVFYAHTISPICIAVLYSVTMIIFIGKHHLTLGIIALAAYAVVGCVIPIITSMRSGNDGLAFRLKSGELSSLVLENLRGLSEIIQYNQGEKCLNRMNTLTDQLTIDEERLKLRAGKNTAATNTIILMFDLAMLFLSARLIGFEGSLIVTLALMGSFGPVVALAALGSTLQNTFAAANRVLDILDEKPVVEDISKKEEISFQGAKCEKVTFSYGEEEILNEMSLTIPQNKIIGINGRSGSGKSTLLKLLMRFWQVHQGAVTISGKDINQINTSNLRSMESLMTQETHLFHDSIRNNLRIAKLNARDEEMIAACKKAAIHEFIMSLPHGYDTEVGELGDTLSGGERQRIGLARAFLHDADLMLLDEPTSNLDSLNEAVILKALDEERSNKTVVLVSHRKSTMKIADTVYSVEHGRMS